LFLVNVKQLNIFSSNSMLNTNESSLVSFRKVVSIFKITKISGQKWTAFLIKVNIYWCGLFLRTVFAIWSRALFYYIGCDYAVLYELFLFLFSLTNNCSFEMIWFLYRFPSDSHVMLTSINWWCRCRCYRCFLVPWFVVKT